MKLKGLIFDLDGVICSTDKFHYAAWKMLADRLGIYFDETINNRLRGVSRADSLEIILEKSSKEYSEAEKAEFLEIKNTKYKEYLNFMKPADVEQAVIDTLKALRKAGLKIACGSASKNARLILQKIELTDFFDAISDGNNIKLSKPDPEVFLKAAEFIGCLPAECIVIEDALAGVEAARRAGMECIAINDAAKRGAGTYQAEHFGQILDIAVSKL